MFKNIILFLISSFLWGCSTTPGNHQENDRGKSTAKTNIQLGLVYLEKHNVQQAKERLLRALEEDPKMPEAQYAMAYFLETTGNPQQANIYYLKAIELAPERGDVQNNYGTFLCRHKQYQKAVQHFLLAVQDSKYLETASAYENAGLCSLKIPNQKQAIVYFKRALQEDPNHPTSLLELAKLNYLAGDYVLAKQQLNQFLIISEPTPQSRWLARQLENKMETDIHTRHLKWNYRHYLN
jgi:type IV pilus assembly protein PilF